MPTFRYKAKDGSGNTIAGTIEAPSESQAAAAIREQGNWPMEIRPASAAGPAPSAPRMHYGVAHYLIHPIWTGVSVRSILFFYRQLSTMLNSGMGLSEALSSAGRRTGGKLGRIVREAATNVQAGRPLSDTLARYPRVFAPIQLSLLRAGESGGLLEQMVDRIAAYLEADLNMRRRLAVATFYPKLLFVAILFIPLLPIAVLGTLPQFLEAAWSRASGPLVWFVVLVVGIKLLFQFDAVRLIWDFAKLQIPVLGWAARKMAMARFSRALAMLYSAGLPIAESVDVSADACANVWLAMNMRRAIGGLRSGQGLAESLGMTGTVSPLVLDMLATGEKTGSIDATLHKAADYLEEEADMTMQKVAPTLFVVLVLLAGIAVLFAAMPAYQQYGARATGGEGAP